ncbi:MAG: glycosyltransferase [Proteobacteria bacterium]|nr:glycosyltransferase [Pseudomonadota bacterium]
MRSRPDYKARRADPRYISNFPVNIYVGEGENEQVYHAIAKDISDGGLFLENIDIPETETRIRLDFKIPDGTMPEEYLQGNYRILSDVIRHDPQKRQIAVAFKEKLSARLARSTWNLLRWAAIVGIFLTVSMILLTKVETFYFFWFDVPVFLYSLTVGSYLISRFLFASFYRPPQKQEYLPTITIIIPAYNEEVLIESTLASTMEVSYPRDKLQVIVINDCSTDGTLATIKNVRERYPEIIVVDFTENRGKRHALAAGVRISTGEVLVFVDSDCFLDPGAIRNIIDGFADPKVAAVCGHCEVANAWTNSLTKMQAVRYYISFRVLKAAESIFDSVTCLSGSLAAYRRTTLMEVLDDWIKQTFLGQPAIFGDDRSLTNYLLKRNHKIIYDSRARIVTVVPENYKHFFSQQMRWKRSWFRETARAASFMWRKQPLMSLSFYAGFILPLLGPAIVFRAMIYIPFFHNGSPLRYIFGVFLMSALMSTTYLLAKRSRLWMYGSVFCFFYMFVLIWQLPWAILTFWTTVWSGRVYNPLPNVVEESNPTRDKA